MSDLRDPRLLYLKGGLFLLLGLMAAGLLVSEHPEWRFVALLALTIWAFARAYYFAFYVVEHYVDPNFRFAGLWAFARYLLARRKTGPDDAPRNEAAPDR